MFVFSRLSVCCCAGKIWCGSLGPPPKCTLLVHYNGPKEYTWAAAPRFSMWAANRPANGQVDLPRKKLLKSPQSAPTCTDWP